MLSKSLHNVMFSLFYCTGASHCIYLLIFDGHLNFPILPVKTYASGTRNDRSLVSSCLAVRYFLKWPYHFPCPHSIYEGVVLFSHIPAEAFYPSLWIQLSWRHAVTLCYCPANRFILLEKFQVHRRSLQKQSSWSSFSRQAHTYIHLSLTS